MSDQSLQALASANAIRIPGGKWRRKMAALDYETGCRKLAEVLEERAVPVHIGALKIIAFLTSVYHLGNERAERICQEAHIYRHTCHRQALRVRDLTERERRNLAAELRVRANGQHK